MASIWPGGNEDDDEDGEDSGKGEDALCKAVIVWLRVSFTIKWASWQRLHRVSSHSLQLNLASLLSSQLEQIVDSGFRNLTSESGSETSGLSTVLLCGTYLSCCAVPTSIIWLIFPSMQYIQEE